MSSTEFDVGNNKLERQVWSQPSENLQSSHKDNQMCTNMYKQPLKALPLVKHQEKWGQWTQMPHQEKMPDYR